MEATFFKISYVLVRNFDFFLNAVGVTKKKKKVLVISDERLQWKLRS